MLHYLFLGVIEWLVSIILDGVIRLGHNKADFYSASCVNKMNPLTTSPYVHLLIRDGRITQLACSWHQILGAMHPQDQYWSKKKGLSQDWAHEVPKLPPLCCLAKSSAWLALSRDALCSPSPCSWSWRRNEEKQRLLAMEQALQDISACLHTIMSMAGGSRRHLLMEQSLLHHKMPLLLLLTLAQAWTAPLHDLPYSKGWDANGVAKQV